MFALFLAGVAVLSLVSLLVLYRSWSRATAVSADVSSVPEGCPPGVDEQEWQVLVRKRDEIEQDPLLDEPTRETLRQQWFLSAQQVFHRDGGQGLQIISASAGGHAGSAAKWLIPVVLVTATGFYMWVGTPQTAALQVVSGPGFGRPDDRIPSGTDRHPGGAVSMEDRIKALEARLAQEPDNLAGWALLSRAKASQRDFAGSTVALEKALALAPGHPDILADLADMVAMQQDSKMAGRPLDLVSQALKSDPDNEKALALAATAAEQANDKNMAERYWTRLKAVQNNKAQAELLANQAAPGAGQGGPSGMPAPGGVAGAPGSSSGTNISAGSAGVASSGAEAITGTVTLSPSLKTELTQKGLPPTAMLYILAKPLSGPPMPLAVMRLSGAELQSGKPIRFQLDDTLAMAPQMKLSGQQKVNVEARLSFGGQANRAPGDWGKTLAGVKPGEKDISLVIDTVLN